MAGSPIDVTLSSVGGVGALSAVNLTNANVTLDGVAGITALLNYTIGSGGRLTIASTAGVQAGTGVRFDTSDGVLVLGNGIDLNLLNGIAGFSPGNTIDFSAMAANVSYSDNAGTGTGGTLTLLDGNGVAVASIPLTSGEYVAGDFQLSADGGGGTLVKLGIVTTGVTAMAGSASVGPGDTVVLSVTTSAPVSVTGGTPTLALSDGGTAIFDAAASNGNTLVFTHTVMAGQNTPDLEVVGFSTNGATLSDPSGVPVDLSGAITNPAGILSVRGAALADGTIGVYRFFDSNTGTHFLTGDAAEKNALMDPNSASYRPDLTEEVNNFGALAPGGSDPNQRTVYRFFDTRFGTHFFTASQSEADGLKDPGSSSYRADLAFEPSSSFQEHSTQQVGDVAVYRFFDTAYGTHFYTGSQSEYASITTPGTASYRADLVSEGVGFYAPSGSYS